MREIPENLIDVQPEFAAILGMTIAEAKLLSLRELINRAFDRGYDLSVSTKLALSGEGHLTLSVENGAALVTTPSKL